MTSTQDNLNSPSSTAETAPESPATTTSGESTAVDETPSFGWNDYAERLNGRFAMIGFAALLITQLITRQDFWTWIGL